MKKLFCILLIFTCISSTFAQKKFNFGFRVGISANGMFGKNSLNQDESSYETTAYKDGMAYQQLNKSTLSQKETMTLTQGVAASVFFSLNAGKFFSFQPELGYTMRGANFITNRTSTSETINLSTGETMNKSTSDYGPTEKSYKIHSLDIPLLFKFHFANKKPVRPYLLFGPTIALTMNTISSTKSQFYYYRDVYTYMPYYYYDNQQVIKAVETVKNTVDVMGTLGFGLEIPLTKAVALVTDFRAYAGGLSVFRNIQNPSETIYTGSEGSKQSSKSSGTNIDLRNVNGVVSVGLAF